MGLVLRLVHAVTAPWRRQRDAKTVSGYQLWVESLGDDPAAVTALLIEDMFGGEDGVTDADLPELPMVALELPAGSDTFSIVHIKADELERLGAVVAVRSVRSLSEGPSAV